MTIGELCIFSQLLIFLNLWGLRPNPFRFLLFVDFYILNIRVFLNLYIFTYFLIFLKFCVC